MGSMIVEYAIAGIIRYLLLNSDYMQLIADRIEVSTPINSWKRGLFWIAHSIPTNTEFMFGGNAYIDFATLVMFTVKEGAHLLKVGVDPYEGDMFHESPLILVTCSWLLTHVPRCLPILFVMCDLATAFALQRTALLFSKELIQRQQRNLASYAKGASSVLLKNDNLEVIPKYAAAAYLFNPYSILNCVGMTTTVFTNLFLAICFYSMVKGWRFPCCIALSLATSQALYPFVLISPAAIYLSKQSTGKINASKIVQTIILFLMCNVVLTYTSYCITGSFTFLGATYGAILNVPDLRPNIGLFWYFFIEMFEHFCPLFLSAFQINVMGLYLLPLTFKLKDEPMLLATSLTALITIFKSYASVGDVAFYLALMTMWKHLFNCTQQGFVIGCFFLVTSVLGPTVWHLWIYSRSGNANFFFGVTLAFATAQIFLLTDVLFAYVKREFTLKHGVDREIKGKPAKLVLE